jgi:hypothetical protein
VSDRAIEWIESLRRVRPDVYSSGSTGFAYFVRAGDDGPVKIGWSVHPKKRLAELQVGNPYPLEIVGMIPGNRGLEGDLHHIFAEWRLTGEWFEAEADGLAELIDFSHTRLAV